MDVCLILLLLFVCLSLLANGNPLSQTSVMSNEIRFPPNVGSKGGKWHWNPSPFTKVPESAVGKTKGKFKIENGGDEEFEKAVKAISSLEISKSIELVFDPKTQALVPTTEVPRKSQREYKRPQHGGTIVLLSPKTYKKLQKILEDLERDGKKGENNVFKNYKNFQTGRFKPKYFRTIKSYRV